MSKMNWEVIDKFDDGSQAAEPWLQCRCIGGRIFLEKRPYYCDRGNWYAKVDIHFDPKIPGTYIDGADGWPRYYFDLDRAKLELEAWINKRGLAL
jgi:hypothetical protein